MKGIYRILNETDDKNYVGASLDLERRITEHINGLNNGRHQNSILQHDFKRNGASFHFEVVEVVDDVDNLEEKESHYINYFDSCFPNGYNQRKGSGFTSKRTRVNTEKRLRKSLQRRFKQVVDNKNLELYAKDQVINRLKEEIEEMKGMIPNANPN